MSSILAILKPMFDYIDSGKLFRQPIQWLYYVLGVIFAIALLASISRTAEFFDLGGTMVVVAVLVIILQIALAAFSVLFWIKRGDDMAHDTAVGARFVAIPAVANIIRCFGEFAGIVIAIFGIYVGVIAGIFWLFSSWRDYVGCPFLIAIGGPVVGYLILLINRFFAESMLAIASIANDTHELATFNPVNE